MELNEPALVYQKRRYTIPEYLELENTATIKHEYYQGELFAMSGATMTHNSIAENLYFHLRLKLKGKPCKPHNSDTRIHIEKNTLFTYPDISVICGEPISLDNDDLNFLNPTIIFEVLSPSTREYDRNEKFRLYKDIPTLKSYILVEPEAINIEAWHMDEQGGWTLKAYNNINELLQIPAINTSLELKEIYEGTEIAG